MGAKRVVVVIIIIIIIIIIINITEHHLWVDSLQDLLSEAFLSWNCRLKL